MLTEHHALWSRESLLELQTHEPGLKLFTGVEVTLKEGYDVVVIGKEPDTPSSAFTAFNELMRRLGPIRDEVFIFCAHPFRYRNEITPSLRKILARIDGIEMNSANILKYNEIRKNGVYKPRNYRTYEQAFDEFQLIPMYNTDTHMQLSVGAFASRLKTDTMPQDEAELAKLLKRSHPEEYQNPLLLHEFLQDT